MEICDVDDELITAWYYENDWQVNDAQRNILQTLVYSKYEVLELANFPQNIRTIWDTNRDRIQLRIVERDKRKKKWTQICLKLMYEVT